MRTLDASAVDAALDYPSLVDVLEHAFSTGAHAPPRHHHTITLDGRPDATWLLMPAWTAHETAPTTAGAYAGVKIVSVFPDNGTRLGRPAIDGVYLLMSTDSGAPLALIDAPRLTTWRTAAASAMASRALARADAKRLVMVGAGALAPFLIRAHASVRPIETVVIWNRNIDKAATVAQQLAADRFGIPITVSTVLEAAVAEADIVSVPTLSAEPVVMGRWLQPGTHLDCVGAYRPDMRETDDDVIRRCRIWVDTLAGATHEAGDIVIPLKARLLAAADIQGDLFGLARGQAPRRGGDREITFFKSVGASIEDLAAAVAVYEADASRR